ncbi:hypothetical protein NQ318_000869 [Aromia moschata]|uniref:Transposase n=1 Tax=Aromia moschata TaxID=1265417 RepID=A0AAV8ZGI9_9CUCU|nr:hypothetical protein NQ318_000869 [Aromia moschata]
MPSVTHSSILHVLTEKQMHPYKLVPTNELVEDDFDRRILFCEQMMQMIDDNTLQIQNVLFSDESTFTLHGLVNRRNCRYWSRENPHWMRELHTQNPEKKISFVFFTDVNLNGETYLALLHNNVVPTTANLYPAEGNPQLPGNAIWFQQDGAPAITKSMPAISPHNLSKSLDRETWFCRITCTITRSHAVGLLPTKPNPTI